MLQRNAGFFNLGGILMGTVSRLFFQVRNNLTGLEISGWALSQPGNGKVPQHSRGAMA